MGAGQAVTVFLVRHAAHDRVDAVLCGRMPDVTLGPAGRAEARRVAERLSGEEIAAVFSSPLERALETAEPIAVAHRLPVQHDDGLHEIDCGEWTGRSFEALQGDERWHAWNRSRAEGCPPNGEPMRAVQARVSAALDRWRRGYAGRAIVAVSHSDVIKALACQVLGLSLDRYHAFEIAPASVTTFVAWEGGGKIVAMNERVPSRAAPLRAVA
jgi:broad specificity phosphatase PhoE